MKVFTPANSTPPLAPDEVARASGAVKNPSFVAIHPTKRFLYAVSEVADYKDTGSGAVTAFALDPASGRLTALNHQSSTSAGPCHVVVDPTGKNVLVANYGGATAAAPPIGTDGRLAPATSTVRHEGKSVNASRQEAPHPHSINLDPAGRFAFVADLGLDKVMIYRFDPAKGMLTANDPPSAAVPAGSGPRHFAFHPERQVCLCDQRIGLDRDGLQIRRHARPARSDRHDQHAAGRLSGRKHHGRGAGPPVGQVLVRLESWA